MSARIGSRIVFTSWATPSLSAPRDESTDVYGWRYVVTNFPRWQCDPMGINRVPMGLMVFTEIPPSS